MTWVGVLLAVFVVSYVQAVAGFAMGMIIVAVVGGLGLLDLPSCLARGYLTAMLLYHMMNMKKEVINEISED